MIGKPLVTDITKSSPQAIKNNDNGYCPAPVRPMRKGCSAIQNSTNLQSNQKASIKNPILSIL